MTLTIYEETQEQIRRGYANRNRPIIEKETHFIFDKIFTILGITSWAEKKSSLFTMKITC